MANCVFVRVGIFDNLTVSRAGQLLLTETTKTSRFICDIYVQLVGKTWQHLAAPGFSWASCRSSSRTKEPGLQFFREGASQTFGERLGLAIRL